MADSDIPAPLDPAAPAPARGGKAPTAFRTISEVAADLDVPQHVLRFWESKFPQIRPLKRGGGRRYYRPDDVALLTRIRALLYAEGYTIKGVQRLLQEGGGRSPTRATAAATPPQQTAPVPEADVPMARPPVSGAPSQRLAPDQRQALSRILDDLREIRAETVALA